MCVLECVRSLRSARFCVCQLLILYKHAHTRVRPRTHKYRRRWEEGYTDEVGGRRRSTRVSTAVLMRFARYVTVGG